MDLETGGERLASRKGSSRKSPTNAGQKPGNGLDPNGVIYSDNWQKGDDGIAQLYAIRPGEAF